MPASRRTLETAAVAELSDALFTGCGSELFGLELEWPVHRHGDVAARPAPADLRPLDGVVLPAGSRISFEPGGQVELSTYPLPSVLAALDAVRTDSRLVFARMAEAGFTCQTIAVDDRRPPSRVLTKPRYRAMEAFFDRHGETGRWMMANTASTQINVSHDPADPALRWDLLTRLAPVLVAAFANSPGVDACGRRWASLRQAIWWSIDPSRTRPVRADLPATEAWTLYALDAQVMLTGCADHVGAAPEPGLTFGQWMARGHALGWPTIEDLRTHLTTLFPPVRPRGWLELRVLDALPEWIREVAALTVAVACVPVAARDLLDRLGDTGTLWPMAIRDGMADPAVAAAAATLFDVATGRLGEVDGADDHAEQIAEFRARYVDRGRSPGDDLSTELDMRVPCPVPSAGAA